MVARGHDVLWATPADGVEGVQRSWGLPQLCLPRGADQFLNAGAVASAGAGISLLPAEATASAIRDAVSRLLGDAAYREAAVAVSRSIATMPTPERRARIAAEPCLRLTG